MTENVRADRLISYLQSDLWEERAAAIDALAATDDPRVTPLLIELLKDPVTTVRGWARETLDRRKDLRISDIEQLLDDPDPHVRKSVTSIIGLLGSDEAIPLLLKASQDQDPDVRVSAVFELGVFENSTLLHVLRDMASDPDQQVRKYVADAIERIENPVSEDAMESLMVDDLRELVDDVEKSSGELDNNYLRRALKNLDREPSATLARLHAAEELGERGEIDAVPDLMEAMADSVDLVRGTAAIALDQILDRCATIDELDAFELKMNEGMNNVPDWPMDDNFNLIYRLQNAKIGELDQRLEDKQKIARAEMKEMLDMPKPKPPKGNGNKGPGKSKGHLKLV